MAIDFSKLNFFSRLDARARIFFLVAVVAAFVFVVYVGTRFLLGGGETTGPSRVAAAPQGLQSVQGGTLTPEYQRALQQANVQSAQQAQMTAGSAIPTMINYGGAQQSGCVVCTEDNVNVKNNLDDLVKQGKISPDVAAGLQALADKNVSVDEYAAALDKLVREGKLTPEQARALLDAYKRQHANRLLQESGKAMDALIKAGKLPLDVANALLAAQRNGMSPAEYAAMLQDLVRQGKISPETAAQLLAQYAQQRAREIIAKSIVSLEAMRERGEITPDVTQQLTDLEQRMVPFDAYSQTLQQLVSAGKVTPAVARRILDEYSAQKKAIGTSATLDALVQEAVQAALNEVAELLKQGKIKQDVAAQLVTMINSNLSEEDFQKALIQMVQQKQLTPEIAKLKMADYQKIKCRKDMSQRLGAMQSNNASATDYANELKKNVASGCITPEQAAQLLQEYQALTAPTGLATTAVAGTPEFAALQQRVAAGAGAPVAAGTDFTTASLQAATVSSADRQAHIDALRGAMEGQAAQLITAWQPQQMVHREGSYAVGKGACPPSGKGPSRLPPGVGGKGEESMVGAPAIKAGTILFAVLDTAVNSDYPDAPVMATIVQEGKFNGARLLGKVVITKGIAGQMDRVSLNFTMMDEASWPQTKNVTAYAIDPDTARTVMASSVNYHYLIRYGAIMATSFLQGYATAITNEGTSTTGIFGTSTTHPALSPGQKIAVALGQIGQNLGSVTQNYINIPPTVRVDSGVGLGILFMADVT